MYKVEVVLLELFITCHGKYKFIMLENFISPSIVLCLMGDVVAAAIR